MDVFFIIFSAGLGTRLKTNFPKPLSTLLNSTLIDYNINSIIKLTQLSKIKNFIIYINLHKSADKIYKHITQNYHWLIHKGRLKFLFEHKLLGHIGTINKLKYHILRYNKLITLNSDTFIPDFHTVLLNLINHPYDYILLYKIPTKSIEDLQTKTITHFLIDNLKVTGFTKNFEELNKAELINLYTGSMLINIDRELSLTLLDKKFNELNFLDFIKILINKGLYSYFISNFYEVTTIKDLLKLNVTLLCKSFCKILLDL